MILHEVENYPIGPKLILNVHLSLKVHLSLIFLFDFVVRRIASDTATNNRNESLKMVSSESSLKISHIFIWPWIFDVPLCAVLIQLYAPTCPFIKFRRCIKMLGTLKNDMHNHTLLIVDMVKKLFFFQIVSFVVCSGNFFGEIVIFSKFLSYGKIICLIKSMLIITTESKAPSLIRKIIIYAVQSKK